MRIASVYWPELAPAHYRSVIPMAALQRRGHNVSMFPQVEGEDISIDALARHDLVHVHRLIVNDDDSYVERLHEAGVPVCFDNDDDVMATTGELWEELPGVTLRNVAPAMREGERARELLPAMDLVTTPSEVLAERFRASGARDVRVIDNYVPSEFMRMSPVGREGFIVGWHAGHEHHWDRDALHIDRLLGQILDTHPHVHVVTLGVDLRLDSNRYTYVDGVPLADLTNNLADFDIGIAPLAESDFNASRSAVKLREYASASVPWLASARGPYRGLGKEHGGRLVEDDEWLQALEATIRAPIERARLRRRAKIWTRREMIDETARLWEEAFLDVVESTRASRVA